MPSPLDLHRAVPSARPNHVASSPRRAPALLLLAILVLSLAAPGGFGLESALASDGTLDPTFNPNSNAMVHAVRINADGTIYVAGEFTSMGGTTRNRVARLNYDGSVDTTFLASPLSGAESIVYALAVQADGKVLIGGTFTSVNGTARNRIARLNTDGTLDTSFLASPLSGAPSTVRAIALQSDGKVIVGGDFQTFNGTTRNRIARLNTDGTLDTTFNPNANGNVYAISVMSDDKLAVGGEFTTFSSSPPVTRRRVAMLNADGTVDTSFNPGVGGSAGANNSVFAVAVQTDGKVVIGGQFLSVSGTTRNRIARMNADGTHDTSFDPGTGPNNVVRAIVLQADGKMLIGGEFDSVAGTARNRIARLNGDGSLDTGFLNGVFGADGRVHAIAIDATGAAVIGGDFTFVNGTSRNRLARLDADACAPLVTLSPTSQTVAEGDTVNFTANASGYTSVQWQVQTNGAGPFVDIPDATSTTLSFTATLANNNNVYQAVFATSCGSATTSPATLTVNPGSCTAVSGAAIDGPDGPICAGDIVTLTASATGAGPFTYEWQRSPVGAGTWTTVQAASTNSQLVLDPVGSTSYDYQVVVANDCPSSDTSDAATVTITPSPADVVGSIDCAGANCINNGAEVLAHDRPYVYTVNIAGGTSFAWDLGANASLATIVADGDANDNSITLKFSKDWPDGGLLSVVASGPCGTGSAITKAITVVGFDSQFNAAAAPGTAEGWNVVYGPSWVLSGSTIQSTVGSTTRNMMDSVAYSEPFQNYTYEATLKRTAAPSAAICGTCTNGLWVRGSTSMLTLNNIWGSGYLFQYSASGLYSIWRVNGGVINVLVPWIAPPVGPVVNTGSGASNVLRVEVAGNVFAFYINGTLVDTITDTSASAILGPGLPGIAFSRLVNSGRNDRVDADYAKLGPTNQSIAKRANAPKQRRFTKKQRARQAAINEALKNAPAGDILSAPEIPELQ